MVAIIDDVKTLRKAHRTQRTSGRGIFLLAAHCTVKISHLLCNFFCTDVEIKHENVKNKCQIANVANYALVCVIFLPQKLRLWFEFGMAGARDICNSLTNTCSNFDRS